MSSFPAAPTALGIVFLIIVVAYWLLRDRSAFLTQTTEIAALRKRIDDQADRHHKDVLELNGKMGRLEALYDEQRSKKHQALNDVARLQLALAIVRRLQRECTCAALAPIDEILSNLAEHGEVPG